MDRCVEMWFDGPEEWYHCAVENAASFKKPEWAEYDNFPYLRPQFQFASLFLTDIATSDQFETIQRLSADALSYFGCKTFLQ